MRPQRLAIRQSAVTLLRQRLATRPGRFLGTDSPIVPMVLGTEQAALEMSVQLRDAGLFVPAIRPPTVPRGTSRLPSAYQSCKPPRRSTNW